MTPPIRDCSRRTGRTRASALLLSAACTFAAAGCGSGADAPRPLDSQQYAEQRERELNDSGPTWEQQLAAAPGADDVDRAIALLRRGDEFDYRAVSSLANELDVTPDDERIRRALIDVVNEAAFPSRDVAAGALAKHDVTEARTALLRQLEQPNFAGPVVVALGALGDESSVRELDYLAEHTADAQVARNARTAKQLIEERLAAADAAAGR